MVPVIFFVLAMLELWLFISSYGQIIPIGNQEANMEESLYIMGIPSYLEPYCSVCGKGIYF